MSADYQEPSSAPGGRNGDLAGILQRRHARKMTESGFDALMHEVCAGWGFCGCQKDGQSLHVTLLIPPRGPITADQFAEWIFLADNINPNAEPERWKRHKAAIRAAFVGHMGAEVVDANQLRWSDAPPEEDNADVKYRGHIS